MIQNGHNGHLPTDRPDELLANKSSRGDLRLILMALRQGWDIPKEAFKDLPAEAYRIAMSASNERERIGAIKCLIAMQAGNVDLAVAADKADRLDTGKVTERVEHKTYTVRFDDRG